MVDWVAENDPEAETTWDEEEEQEEVVGDIDTGDGGKRTRSKSGKRAKTTERNSSSSDDGGATAAAAEGSSSLTNTKAALTLDPRERHKLAERERRKSMRELFLSLHALLPNGDTVRKEQSAILDEIIKHIPLAVSRLRSLRIDAQRRQRARHRSDSIHDPEIREAGGADFTNYTSTPSSSNSSSSASLSSSSSSSDMTTTDPVLGRTRKKRPRESSSPVNFYACQSRSGSTNSLNTLAIGAPSRSRTRNPSTTLPFPGDCCAVDIRVAPEPSSSVSIRLRGDRVNVSLTDHSYSKQPTPPAPSSAQPVLLLSAVVEELDAHQLELIRSTHCRDGSKLLHYSESKILPDQESMEGSHASASIEVLKRRLQHLASKLRTLRKMEITTTTCGSSY